MLEVIILLNYYVVSYKINGIICSNFNLFNIILNYHENLSYNFQISPNNTIYPNIINIDNNNFITNKYNYNKT